jgi:adenylosuccinate synthase
VKPAPRTSAPVLAIIGAQWGDEGKGKIIDFLAQDYDIVARACGGANAGHTIVVGGTKHIFRLLPSGCLRPEITVVLGSGMVIHLPTLLEEIDLLRQCGIDILPRLKISREAHIVFDVHKAIDAAMEERRAQSAGGIGTTRRGIGPAFMDKAARTGIRMERLGDDLTETLRDRAKDIARSTGITLDVVEELRHVHDAQTMIGDCVIDTVRFLHDALDAKRRILIEGAQATLLDIDHGSYPFVTSSATTAAGALQGLGLPPSCLTEVIGVAKAYCTRVGAGGFPTEATGATGDRLRERGGEYGSVTRRPRRCGWLHLPDLLRSAQINGFTRFNITKLDVLDTEEVVPVAIEEQNGKVEYREFPGWMTSTQGVTDFAVLPAQAQKFLTFIEEQAAIPVSFIGTGQGREAMIVR